MAIKSEPITINGKDYVRTYSDAHRLIERDGARYAEAVDPADCAADREYTETDVQLYSDSELAQAARILLGVE